MEWAQVINYVVQAKEVIALVSMIWLVMFIMTKHIPFLLMRSDERSERESNRHHQDRERLATTLDKLVSEIAQVRIAITRSIGDLEREREGDRR